MLWVEDRDATGVRTAVRTNILGGFPTDSASLSRSDVRWGWWIFGSDGGGFRDVKGHRAKFSEKARLLVEAFGTMATDHPALWE